MGKRSSVETIATVNSVLHLLHVNETMKSQVTKTYVKTYHGISWDALILCHHVLSLDDNLDEEKEFTLNTNNGEQFDIWCMWMKQWEVQFQFSM